MACSGDRASGDQRDGGFTLIELLIVVIILGILAAIVVMAIGNSTADTMTAACQTDYREVQTALEAYKVENGSYPEAGVTPGVGSGVSNAIIALVRSVPTPTGAWLRDPPYYSGHFQIVVPADGSGTVAVYTAPQANPSEDGSVSDGSPLGSDPGDISACEAV